MATISRRAPAQAAQSATWRIAAVVLVLVLAGGGLVARLAFLQIVQHRGYSSEAAGEHLDQVTVPAHRGALLDANGFPLAVSVATYDIAVDRHIWQDAATAQRGAQALAPLLNRTPEQILSLLGDATTGPATIVQDVDYSTGRQIAALGLPGVLAQPREKRVNPEGDLASPVLGFVGRDGGGLTGLELDENNLLTGLPGSDEYERDALGNPIAAGVRKSVDPQPGSDVELTIDRNIQQMCEQELKAGIDKTHATGGTCIVMDPTTGAILAMDDEPSFKLSTLDLSADPQGEGFKNGAVTDVFEPGSVFKLFTMSAGIDSGKVNPNTTYIDTCQVVVAQRIFHNWDYSCNGPTTMTTVLVRSLNLGTLWLTTKVLGPDIFYKYVRAFGFGEPTGSGLSGDASGIVRTNADTTWSLADLASNSFGQGISVSALQMITGVAAIVNGGNLLQPYIVKEVHSNGTTRLTQPTIRRRVISSETAATIREMMKQVLAANTFAPVPGYSAGGKSGTAYVPTVATKNNAGDAYAQEVTIPSYIGFAPFDHPRVLIYVKLDNLKSADFGGVLTAPMFSHLASEILTYLDVAPDRPLPAATETTAAGR